MQYTYDYTKTMMMKLLMANPDGAGGSDVLCNAENALDIIRQVDNITLGIKKIIYLVGWQYLGHDDKYPAFFEVNDGIKRHCDNDARESLLWLIEEAKKYNTVVSLHINFADAYEDSPLYEEYLKNNALIRKHSGKPAPIEKYNGKPCYKVSYKEEWESGLFKKRIDRLFEFLPIRDMGTVHVDNFQCYVNVAPYVSAEEMMYYRGKMIDYLAEKGVDITTEFTYREGKITSIAYGKIVREITKQRYSIACLNKVPAVWWADKMTLEEYFAYYPHIYGGGLPRDTRAANLFYGNIHGEDLFGKENWQKEFTRQFFAINVPFFYLNQKERVGFVDKTMHKVKYSDGVVSSDCGVITNAKGEVVRSGRMRGQDGGKKMDSCKVFLPFNGCYVAYSDEGGEIGGSIENININWLFEVTPQGLKKISELTPSNGKVSFIAQSGKAYVLK